MWAPPGWMSQWCNRPPMRERSSRKTPLISGRFFFWGNEAEAGSGLVVVFHPSLRNGVGIQAQESRPSSPASASSLLFC